MLRVIKSYNHAREQTLPEYEKTLLVIWSVEHSDVLGRNHYESILAR